MSSCAVYPQLYDVMEMKVLQCCLLINALQYLLLRNWNMQTQLVIVKVDNITVNVRTQYGSVD